MLIKEIDSKKNFGLYLLQTYQDQNIFIQKLFDLRVLREKRKRFMLLGTRSPWRKFWFIAMWRENEKRRNRDHLPNINVISQSCWIIHSGQLVLDFLFAFLRIRKAFSIICLPIVCVCVCSRKVWNAEVMTGENIFDALVTCWICFHATTETWNHRSSRSIWEACLFQFAFRPWGRDRGGKLFSVMLEMCLIGRWPGLIIASRRNSWKIYFCRHRLRKLMRYAREDYHRLSLSLNLWVKSIFILPTVYKEETLKNLDSM